MIVGEGLTSENCRQGLAEKNVEVVEEMAERVESGALRIFVPKRTIHTKLYFLGKPGLTRVIQSSANMTQTARKATRQMNYAWYVEEMLTRVIQSSANMTQTARKDLPDDHHPWLAQVEKDFQVHMKGCTLFMDDLMTLIRERPAVDRKQLIGVWLKGAQADEVEKEFRGSIQQISIESLETNGSREEPIITVQIPDAPKARKSIERFLAPVNPVVTTNEIHVNGTAYIRYVQEVHGIPLMRVNASTHEVLLGINGSVTSLSESLPDHASVNAALE